jgi:SNF2 family DNA or RNA helicase
MVEQQAIGRALRLGQTQKVVVSRYITKGTIEEVCFISCICLRLGS